MASTKSLVLSLYRRLLRGSQDFTSYNYREYALRRIRDAFKENKSVTDTTAINALVTKAEQTIGLIQRQTLMGRMYSQPKLVLEHRKEQTVKHKTDSQSYVQ